MYAWKCVITGKLFQCLSIIQNVEKDIISLRYY